MQYDLSQIVARKMQILPENKQREILEFVESMQKPFSTEDSSLLDKLKAISQSVSGDIWDRFPKDGAENIDHYLYGAPKKSE